MEGPLEQGAVERGLHRPREAVDVTRPQFALGPGVPNQRCDSRAHAQRPGLGVLQELPIVQVELQERNRVRHFVGVAPITDMQSARPSKRRQRRPVFLPQAREDKDVATRSVSGRGQQRARFEPKRWTSDAAVTFASRATSASVSFAGPSRAMARNAACRISMSVFWRGTAHGGRL